MENRVRTRLEKKELAATPSRTLSLVRPSRAEIDRKRAEETRDNETRQMRSFATLMVFLVPVFTMLVPWALGKGFSIWPLGVSGVFALVGTIAPRLLIKPFGWWMKLGHVLGAVNSRILLGIIFFFIFTPMGFFRRRFNDTMKKKWEPDSKTYRQPRVSPDLIQRMEVPY